MFAWSLSFSTNTNYKKTIIAIYPVKVQCSDCIGFCTFKIKVFIILSCFSYCIDIYFRTAFLGEARQALIKLKVLISSR